MPSNMMATLFFIAISFHATHSMAARHRSRTDLSITHDGFVGNPSTNGSKSWWWGWNGSVREVLRTGKEHLSTLFQNTLDGLYEAASDGAEMAAKAATKAVKVTSNVTQKVVANTTQFVKATANVTRKVVANTTQYVKETANVAKKVVVNTTQFVKQKVTDALQYAAEVSKDLLTGLVTIVPEDMIIGLFNSEIFLNALVRFLQHTPFLERLVRHTEILSSGLCAVKLKATVKTWGDWTARVRRFECGWQCQQRLAHEMGQSLEPDEEPVSTLLSQVLDLVPGMKAFLDALVSLPDYLANEDFRDIVLKQLRESPALAQGLNPQRLHDALVGSKSYKNFLGPEYLASFQESAVRALALPNGPLLKKMMNATRLSDKVSLRVRLTKVEAKASAESSPEDRSAPDAYSLNIQNVMKNFFDGLGSIVPLEGYLDKILTALSDQIIVAVDNQDFWVDRSMPILMDYVLAPITIEVNWLSFSIGVKKIAFAREKAEDRSVEMAKMKCPEERQKSKLNSPRPPRTLALADVTGLLASGCLDPALRCCCDKPLELRAAKGAEKKIADEDRAGYCVLAKTRHCGAVKVEPFTRMAHVYSATDGRCEILKSNLEETLKLCPQASCQGRSASKALGGFQDKEVESCQPSNTWYLRLLNVGRYAFFSETLE